MKRINEAYSVLKDETSRKAYDAILLRYAKATLPQDAAATGNGQGDAHPRPTCYPGGWHPAQWPPPPLIPPALASSLSLAPAHMLTLSPPALLPPTPHPATYRSPRAGTMLRPGPATTTRPLIRLLRGCTPRPAVLLPVRPLTPIPHRLLDTVGIGSGTQVLEAPLAERSVPDVPCVLCVRWLRRLLLVPW